MGIVSLPTFAAWMPRELALVCRAGPPGSGGKLGLNPFPEHLPQLWTHPACSPTPCPESESRSPGICEAVLPLPPSSCRGRLGHCRWGGDLFRLQSRGQMQAGPMAPRPRQLGRRGDPFPKIAHPLSGGHLFVFPNVSLHRLRVVRQEGGTLVLKSEAPGPPPPPRLPRPPQGPDCVTALNAPACHGHRLLSLMSSLWEWPFVAGSGHAARARALRRLDFPAASHLSQLMGQWEAPALPCLPFSVFSGMCTQHFDMEQKRQQRGSPTFSASCPGPGCGGASLLAPSSRSLLGDLSPPLSPSSCSFWVSPGSFPCRQAHVSRPKQQTKSPLGLPGLGPLPSPPSLASGLCSP